MASRVNTKFILILVCGLFITAMMLGALYYLRVRNDTTRHIKAGDQLMAEGDYEKAMKTYQRAVGAEPSNMGYLAKMEQALLKMTPETATRASELYSMRVGVLHHAVRYRPDDAERHLNLIRERFELGRLVRVSSIWRNLILLCDDMLDNVAEDDPQRAYAYLYRGIANLRLPDLDADQRESAYQDLQRFLDRFPDNDLGWANMAGGQLIDWQRLRLQGDQRTAEKRERFLKTMDIALKAVPEGAGVARVNAHQLLLRRVADEADVTQEMVAQATERYVQLLAKDTDAYALIEASEVLPALDPDDGFTVTSDMIKAHAAAHPDALFHTLVLAQQQFYAQKLDESVATCREIIDSKPLPVCMMSSIQPELKVRAAGLIVDCEFRRWEVAAAADRPAVLPRIEAARAELASLVTDPDASVSLMRADGKLAMARGDDRIAADKFEQVNKLIEGSDFEMLVYGGITLARIQQVGRAQQRFQQALAISPGNVRVMIEKARLEANMRRFDEAQQTIDAALRADEQNEEANMLAAYIARERGAAGPSRTVASGSTTDAPPREAIPLVEAERAFSEGDYDLSRELLQQELARRPDDVRILTNLVRVELAAGNQEEALRLTGEVLRIDPRNQQFLAIESTLKNSDRIAALEQFVERAETTEADRAVQLFVSLDAMAAGESRKAADLKSRGEADAAAAAEQLAARAAEKAATYRRKAEELAPNDRRLIAQLFERAVADKRFDDAAAIVQRAQAADADQVGGLLFKGRLQLEQGQNDEAVRTLSQAAAQQDYSSVAWRLLGLAYERMGNLSDAKVAYQNAYDNNPNNIAIVKGYLRLLLRASDSPRALSVLRTARVLAPDDEEIQDTWLQLEFQVGNQQLAMERRRERYADDPANRINALRLAMLLVQARPTRETVVDASGKPRFEPREWSVMAIDQQRKLLDQVKAKWIEESDKILATIEGAEGVTLDTVAVRAAARRAQGDIDGAVKSYRDFISAAAEDQKIPASVALASFLAESGRVDPAIDALEEALPLQDPSTRDIDMAIGNLCFMYGRFAQAAEHYRAAIQDTPNLQVQQRLVECYTRLGRFDEAEQMLEKLMAAEGRTFMAVMLRASTEQARGMSLLVSGDLQGAEQRFSALEQHLNEAAALDSSNPSPHVMRAQCLLARFNRTGAAGLLGDSLDSLDRAEQIRAADDSIRMVRVSVLRARNDLVAAAGELERMLEENPEHLVARDMLVGIHVERDNLDAAVRLLEEAIEKDPNFVMWHRRLADVLEKKGDIPGAVAACRHVLELQPDRPTLLRFTELALGGSNPDYRAVQTMLNANQKELDSAPVLRAMYARALALAGDRREAQSQMQMAYTRLRELISWGGDPDQMRLWYMSLAKMVGEKMPAEIERAALESCQQKPDATDYRWIARAWALSGPDGYSRAVELSQKAIEACPPSDRTLLGALHRELAEYYAVNKDWPNVLRALTKANELNPNDHRVLNNLAYILAEQMGEPDRALAYAERAVALAPTDPNYADTLGWAYYRTGNMARAEQELRRATGIRGSATNLTHLAQVLLEKGDAAGAADALRQAEKLQPDPDTQAQIERLRVDINSRS
jgi:tetratricopeptide (TPR) repeat protein